MSKYSAIDALEAIVDGDTIVPGMNFVLPSGVGTTQYYNPSTGQCTPNYKDKPIMLYPYCYSSSTGRFLVPSSEQMMWYMGNPEAASSQILTAKGGAVADAYKDRFELTTYTVNNQTFPALKVKGNLASAQNLNDVTIYFRSTFNGMEVTCHGSISIKESVGDMFDILINCVNEDGLSDTVIDNDTECLILQPMLLNCGEPVSPSGSWGWKRATSSGLENLQYINGIIELAGADGIRIFHGAVEGTEEFFACVEHNGATYRKGIQVCDTHDPYYINVGRSQAGNLVRQSDTVTYTPQVLSRSGNTVQSGWEFSFVARDNEGNVVLQSSKVSTFSVEGSLVHEHGGLNIHISASKS